MKQSMVLVLVATGLLFLCSCKARENVTAIDGTQDKKQQPMPERVREFNRDPASGRLISGINEFASELDGLMAGGSDNYVFSPLSISAALAMTGAGARENTAIEMNAVLHQDLQSDQNHDAYKNLSALFDPPGQVKGQAEGQDKSQVKGQVKGQADYTPGRLHEAPELAMANALWVHKKFALRKDYTDLCKEYYEARTENLDFSDQQALEASRQEINQWVAGITRNRIRELIGDGLLTTSTRLVLTNAIYFRGNWMLPFNPNRTREGDFWIDQDEKAVVPFMNQQKYFDYFEDEEHRAVSLTYMGNQYAMLLVMPRDFPEGNGYRVLSPDQTANILSGLQSTELKLSMPKFRVESKYTLNDLLKQLGMADAFSEDADFSGMTGKKDLYLQFVVHKAFIDVNEAGTEAAAATGAGMALKSALRPDPLTFRIDRPFHYYIYHKPTGLLLFSGQYLDPT